jgi:hypothetical protein
MAESSPALNLAFVLTAFLVLAAILRRRKRRQVSFRRVVNHSARPFLSSARQSSARRRPLF